MAGPAADSRCTGIGPVLLPCLGPVPATVPATVPGPVLTTDGALSAAAVCRSWTADGRATGCCAGAGSGSRDGAGAAETARADANGTRATRRCTAGRLSVGVFSVDASVVVIRWADTTGGCGWGATAAR